MTSISLLLPPNDIDFAAFTNAGQNKERIHVYRSTCTNPYASPPFNTSIVFVFVSILLLGADATQDKERMHVYRSTCANAYTSSPSNTPILFVFVFILLLGAGYGSTTTNGSLNNKEFAGLSVPTQTNHNAAPPPEEHDAISLHSSIVELSYLRYRSMRLHAKYNFQSIHTLHHAFVIIVSYMMFIASRIQRAAIVYFVMFCILAIPAVSVADVITADYVGAQCGNDDYTMHMPNDLHCFDFAQSLPMFDVPNIDMNPTEHPKRSLQVFGVPNGINFAAFTNAGQNKERIHVYRSTCTNPYASPPFNTSIVFVFVSILLLGAGYGSTTT
eukprot:518337_1